MSQFNAGDGPIMSFDSHIEGKNAQVALWPSHIEWTRSGKVGLGKMALGVATGGASLLKTGVRGQGSSNTIPIRSVTGVSTRKSGLKTEVVVNTGGGAMAFRCTPAEAKQFQQAILGLIS